jgi:Mg2+ and Co2+ transporter CorA
MGMEAHEDNKIMV